MKHVSEVRVHRYPGGLQRLVYFTGVKLKRLQVGNLPLVRLKRRIYLARQGPVALPRQHNLQQIYQQFRVPLSLDYLQRPAEVDLVEPHSRLVVERLPLDKGAYLYDKNSNGESLAYVWVQFAVSFVPHRLHLLRTEEVGQSACFLFGLCQFVFDFDVAALVEHHVVGRQIP